VKHASLAAILGRFVPKQPSLLEESARVERPWKRCRDVSKGAYVYGRSTGAFGKRTRAILTALGYFRNRSGQWPTVAELTTDMYERGLLPRNDVRLVAPRLSELVVGRVVRHRDGTRARTGGGLLWLTAPRRCRVTGAQARPVAIREAGSETHQTEMSRP
jgi:hypothetical protein